VLPDEKFTFQVVKNDDRNCVLLQGQIDEDTNFEGLSGIESPIVFNFKNLTGISSIGIRSWVNFLKDLGAKEIFYEECSPLIVRQMNMVPSFLGNAKVLSVFVPYVCENCEKEKLVLVSADQFGKNVTETFPCDACKQGEMELDGHPKQYFAFAK
jgi:hypothetical protein